MPVKTHKHITAKHPKHYAKVYWPYLPLILIVAAGLYIGQSATKRSQQGVLAYASNVTSKTLLANTNIRRQANQRADLRVNPNLAAAAQAKANDMTKRDYWSHNTPDGQAPWHFVSVAGYEYQKAGENLAYGFSDSQDTIAGWMNSPEHRENLLDPAYQEVGFGIATSEDYQHTGPATIVVAMYGQPLAGSTAVAPSATKAVTSASPVSHEPAVRNISKAQTLTGGKMPWITFVLGLASGALLIYLVIKHSLSLRRALKKGERYALAHPVLDLTILSFVALSILLSQHVGVIR